MKLHHQKHHATYVNNLNVAEEKYNDAKATSNFFTINHLI
jgi:Fe-Mn family superoxide dismutase